MTEKEKVFQIEIILNCGRAIPFLFPENVTDSLRNDFLVEGSRPIRILDLNNIEILLNPKEIAAMIIQEFNQREQNTPVSRGTH